MQNKHLFNLLSITIFFVLVISLFNPINASAQDDVPPLATEEPITTAEPVATQEPVATGEPVVTEEPIPTEAPVASGESVTEILPIFEQLPEDTVVVVYDENGDILPLASQAAADALVVEPDPQFCPLGLPPLDPGCSPVRVTIAQAVADAYAAGGDGTIYVEAGTFTENVTIDGGLFTGVAPIIFNVVGAGSGLSILDGYIEIFNMNTFTLSGFTVNEYVEVHDNSGALNLTDIIAGNNGGVSDGSAIIDVYNHSGDITLTNVTANNGSDFGARLDNTGSSGNISIDNGTFTGNILGMEVYSGGNITLANSVANSNILNGTYLDTSAGTGDISVTNSIFDSNNLYGLVNYSAGDITLDDITATNQVNSNGIYIDAALYGTGNIIISNSTVTGNGYNGLDAFSDGDITLNGVTITANANNGAVLDNSGGTGDINIINSAFNSNGVYGLESFSAGNITVNNSSANNNTNISADGFYLDTTNGTGDISVINISATGNGNHGLNFQSNGSITLDSVTASANSVDGVVISNPITPGNVNVVNSTFTGNGNYGLEVFSISTITLNGVLANGNTAGGISLDNTFGTGNVTVNNSTFNGNVGYGFQAITAGTTTITSVIANNNGIAGLIVDASPGTGDTSISNSIFSGNTNSGLILTSDGDVILDYVTTSNNTTNDGAFVDAAGNITVTCGSYDNNGGYGVYNSNGSPMTLNSVNFSGNGLGQYNGSPFIINVTCAAPSPGGGNNSAGNGRPLHMVPVTGDPLIDLPTALDCINYRGTGLILPNDDRVIFLCPLQTAGRLDALPIDLLSEVLPGELPQGTNFVSGFVSHLIRSNNTEQTTLLARAALVSFTIPEDKLDADLVILFWNIEEETWMEVEPGIDTGDKRYDACVKTLMGRFDDPAKELFHLEACVDYTGTFVLASQ